MYDGIDIATSIIVTSFFWIVTYFFIERSPIEEKYDINIQKQFSLHILDDIFPYWVSVIKSDHFQSWFKHQGDETKIMGYSIDQGDAIIVMLRYCLEYNISNKEE